MNYYTAPGILRGRRLTLQQISMAVCEQFGLSLEQLRKPLRRTDHVTARYLIMYIARKNGLSLTAIGNFLNRDHTTVIHAVDRIESLIFTRDPYLMSHYLDLEKVMVCNIGFKRA